MFRTDALARPLMNTTREAALPTEAQQGGLGR